MAVLSLLEALCGVDMSTTVSERAEPRAVFV